MAIHHGSHGTPPLPLKLRKARSTPMEAPPVVIRQLASTGAPYCCDRKPPKRGFLKGQKLRSSRGKFGRNDSEIGIGRYVFLRIYQPWSERICLDSIRIQVGDVKWFKESKWGFMSHLSRSCLSLWGQKSPFDVGIQGHLSQQHDI